MYVAVKSGTLDAIAQGELATFRTTVRNSHIVDSILEGGESAGLWDSSRELTKFGRNFTKDDPSGFRAWIVGLVELQGKMLELVPDLLTTKAPFNYENGPREEEGIASAAEGVAKFMGFRCLDKVKILRRPNARVLDVGCGNGEYLIHAAARNPTLSGVGVELSEPLALKARKNIEAMKLSSRLKVIRGGFLSENFDQTFDCCMLNFVLHYFPDSDRPKLMAKCASLLTTNGALVILEPVLCDSGKRQRPETAAFNLNLYPQDTTRFGLPRMNQLEKALREAGLTLVKRIKPFPVGPAMCYVGKK